MEENQWRNENATLDEPEVVQTSTTQVTPLKSIKRRIPWKWVIFVLLFILSLLASLLILKYFTSKSTTTNKNQGQVKPQDVNLGDLANVATPLKADDTDKVIINGQLQTTQGIVINPTSQPTVARLGQIYLESTTGEL